MADVRARVCALIYGYCRKSGLQDADAADVAQEVLKQVSRSIRGFVYDQQKGRFRDWLRTIARNKVRRFLERQKRGLELSGDPESLNGRAEGTADAEWADDFHAHVLKVVARPDPAPVRIEHVACVRANLDRRRRRQGSRAIETGLAIDQVYAAKSRVLKQLRAEVLMLAEDLSPFVRLNE